jgi:hypothetical protein
MAARPKRRRRRPPQALETIAVNRGQFGERVAENPLQPVPGPEDLLDLILAASGLDDASQAGVDDRRWPARLGDQQRR